ncbi:LOW QUALITY PROTEIN: hypothetical protein SPRG_14514 [Saprolegnia parasitica CBS 223.65]|uniref:Uncharacterized protein n=1 Tax=Saprolegnia parasitica (strain CBS 223.65) TaxID=695850 RepID=A0A067C0V7_SAPPC|nr:LOW QUALITY PROTEIN: hypothetical protein SPRG_14514 [Saprolegnia parasitica CBS 223.65]KDO20166.1 LOW QUALITY PROTEIN: hypothetical protein SPRG_14514 [Saprolegnia parasitica CBS 223.65]|eukprot:XP_012209115.1 LOW QUALITY PROTEIN: hypothetical protein SPRG_14514 [Saprolegnia parasitica CBS 223.65]
MIIGSLQCPLGPASSAPCIIQSSLGPTLGSVPSALLKAIKRDEATLLYQVLCASLDQRREVGALASIQMPEPRTARDPLLPSRVRAWRSRLGANAPMGLHDHLKGEIKYYMAHVVAKGYAQTIAIDCTETCSLAIRQPSVRVIT